MAEKSAGIHGGVAKVCLVVSQRQRLTEEEFNSARMYSESLEKQFPDLYIMYLTDDASTFKELSTKVNGSKSRESVRAKHKSNTREIAFIDSISFSFLFSFLFLACSACSFVSQQPILSDDDAERFRFIESNSIAFSTFEASLDEQLRSIPKKIISPFCKRVEDDGNQQRRATWDDVMRRDEFDDYLIPQEQTHYRISSAYLVGSPEVRVKFQNAGYGDITVCMSRNRNMLSPRCQSVVDIDYVWFNISTPCAEARCSSIYFSLTVDTTYLKCSEDDCRFPDNVRIQIRPEGLRCERNGSSQRYIFDFKMLILSLLIAVAAATRNRVGGTTI